MRKIGPQLRVVLRKRLREMMAALPRRYEVEVVRLIGMHDREQRLQARERDRRRRQTGACVGVIWRIVREIARMDGPIILAAEAVYHRRVGLQAHAAAQAIDEDTCDTRAL